MTAYIFGRLRQALLTLWLITVLTFAIAKLAPGSPFGLEDSDQAARVPQEMRDRYRQLYGLDRPVVVQYLSWLGRVARGDLGVSYSYRNETVQDVLRRSWSSTAELGLVALLIALGLGVPLGVGAATRRHGPLDHLSRAVAVFGAAIPVYVLATLCVLLFSVKLHLLPLTGWGSPARLLLPACVLAFAPLALVIRYTRTATLDVLGTDFVRTARAKGLRSRQVIGGHVLKNALLPVLTLAGPMAAALLTGSFFVETIFNVPGLGATFVYAAADRDYPMIMASALLSGSLIILLNLAVDLAYGLLDPRIRLNSSAPGG
jgi:ABC-type dipeptide/oligopeptide/nickel transport system permease component